jgi:predicted transcriptional regulator
MKGGRVPRRGFGELEQAIMEVVWAHEGPVTGREVVDELARSRRVAYTTVLTVMDRLVRKGLLVKQATGRAHRYRPVESREAYTANLMAKMLGTVDNPTAVLLHFVEQLRPEQTDELRSALHTDPDPTEQGTP